jgi:hypothetical protein
VSPHCACERTAREQDEVRTLARRLCALRHPAPHVSSPTHRTQNRSHTPAPRHSHVPSSAGTTQGSHTPRSQHLRQQLAQPSVARDAGREQLGLGQPGGLAGAGLGGQAQVPRVVHGLGQHEEHAACGECGGTRAQASLLVVCQAGRAAQLCCVCVRLAGGTTCSCGLSGWQGVASRGCGRARRQKAAAARPWPGQQQRPHPLRDAARGPWARGPPRIPGRSGRWRWPAHAEPCPLCGMRG